VISTCPTFSVIDGRHQLEAMQALAHFGFDLARPGAWPKEAMTR